MSSKTFEKDSFQLIFRICSCISIGRDFQIPTYLFINNFCMFFTVDLFSGDSAESYKY